MQEIEKYLTKLDGIKRVSSNTGQGGIRFMLTYAPEKVFPSFGQWMIEVDDYQEINSLIKQIEAYLTENYPQALHKFKKFELGPAAQGKIEARFSGADPTVLRSIAKQAREILLADAGAVAVRDDWKLRTKVIRPLFAEAQARKMGISKKDLDDAMAMSFSGKEIGLYRDGTTLMPIVARPPAIERLSLNSLPEIQIWSPVYNRYIPIEQVVSSFETIWEDSIINRRDRKRTIMVIADPNILGDDTANDVFKRVQKKIEAINLPSGYSFEWGGEYENSQKAQGPLFAALPTGLIMMFIITVLLFRNFKQPIIIWSTVPLAIIGVSFGLLLTGAPFTFMALLGFISLIGMIIKNGIVLVDQINFELNEGISPYQAVFESAVSRVRPVSMAAITTILGLIPLLFDAFFSSMAIAVMFGLGFATFLTLVVLPVIYILIYKIKYQPVGK